MAIKNKILAGIEQYKQEETQQLKATNLFSNLRLASFVLGIGFAAALYYNGQGNFGIFMLLVTLTAFFYFVGWHQAANRKLECMRCYIKINENNLARLNGTWGKFSDSGAEFRDPEHPYINDLDVFGENSLFQLMNTTNTYYGRQELQRLLKRPQADIEVIHARQRAVKELAEKSDFIDKLQCVGMMSKGIIYDPARLVQYVQGEAVLFSRKRLHAGVLFVSIGTVISCILAFLDILPALIPGILVICQGILSVAGFKEVSAALDTIHRFKENIKAFKELFAIIQQQEFHESELIKMQEILGGRHGQAMHSIKKLEHIAEAVDVRYNIISYTLFNFFLLWDYHCVFALETWKKQDGKLVERWLSAVAYFEATASLANLARLNPTWSFPILTDKLCFDSKKAGHPLLDAHKRVANDFTLNQGLGIITGSNMSGKTTMLRTVGINLVLAYAGAPVCAKQLTCSVMDIITSMRISDDLGNGISTFYAELLRIKKIIEQAKIKQPMIFLIDEIFRGTNSNDRITGALGVLRNLNKEWVIGLISTHDFELCGLEQEAGIQAVNYHFLESYQEGEIQFDYKIRLGRCYTTNARYLMQLVGIELIE
ncbi:MutS family DNA mismatch repair protein [Sporomusa sp. KB1]|uniref:MutS family DNA mismatch repair protein n=1 Tax=Sporomusa sp. KB1 TaxID=943346 RepID=UPI0011A45153|nr:MutS family DNA mismatch repair protein [Sporomusa sp. KB1]TWH51865.1 Mismatch repair ATPase (MutS family) [Sporomusa sp. KB1]